MIVFLSAIERTKQDVTPVTFLSVLLNSHLFHIFVIKCRLHILNNNIKY